MSSRSSAHELRLQLNLLVAFEFEFAEPDEARRNKAFELTEHFGVSVYDAAYHALATVNHGVFVTANDKYLRRHL